LGGVAVLVAITAPFMARYGWDRDELYFLSAAHHLALGYVDFPPLIALVGWAVGKLAPHSLIALRAISLAAGAGTVLLVAFIARELGGSRRAEWIAAIGWSLTPYILGSASIFHPTWLDALAWVAFLYVTVRLIVRREPRLWLALGVIAGVGLEAKYTIAFLIVALAAALALAADPALLVLERGEV
jgi:4-amino-4-deoxy-L-arabinose transferase-like glycosyltransferase